MPLLLWDHNYSVGIERIDDEHKTFFDMINKAYDSQEDKRNSEIANTLVADMRQYAMFHFETEENLMALYDYPDEQKHLNLHYEFTRRIVRTEAMAATGEEPINLDRTIKFLADWLKEHILVADVQLGQFLKDKDV
ncbi:MAG: bacteriohemerythrin [Pseudodesulfovibrio sp.]